MKKKVLFLLSVGMLSCLMLSCASKSEEKVGKKRIIETAGNEITEDCETQKVNSKTPIISENEIIMGTYEQDGNVENGREAIVWRILATEGNKKLVISKYPLFNSSFTDRKYCTWEDSAIRKELNTEFFENVFTKEEKKMILKTEVDNELMTDMHENLLKSDGVVEDYIFLLSLSEIEKYFKIDNYGFNAYYISGIDLLCLAVESAKDADNREFTIEDYEFGYDEFYPESVVGTYASYWYTRTVSLDETRPFIISIDPAGSSHWFIVEMESTVRPAMWIEVE